MPSKTYIFGHKNPDTDSICSSIAYGELKKQQGYTHYQSARLGAVSKETKFVLDYFHFEEPELLKDVKPQIKDISIHHPKAVNKSDPIKKVWDVMKGKGNKLVPITNEGGLLEGVVSIGDITNIYIDYSDNDLLSRYEIKFSNLIDVLDAKYVCGEYPYENIEGDIFVGHPTKTPTSKKDVLITGLSEKILKHADTFDYGCIILAEGADIDIKKSNCAIYRVKYDIIKLVNLLNQAISISSIMRTHNIISFSTESYIDDIFEEMKTSTHRNFPVLDRNGVFSGVISRRHLIDYERKKVILIDHNERSQSVEGLDQADILEIIDHHRVADIQTAMPLLIRSEPVGCSATIVYKLYRESCIRPKKEVAGLLLAAILSDTLMFSSPTCTDEDKKIAETLADIAGVNIEEFGRGMFSAGSSLTGYTPEQILNIDRKAFSFDKYSVSISQVNTLDFRSIVDKKEELIAAMTALYDNNQYDLVILLITDIVAHGSEILAVGKAKELLNKAFSMDVKNDSFFLPGVVSRKKQIVPNLIMASQM